MSEAGIGTQWKKGQPQNPKSRRKRPKPLPDQGEMVPISRARCSAPEMKTAPITGEKTGPETGPITGVKTGVVTGLRHALLSQQPIDTLFESPIRVNDVESFVAQLQPNGINGVHMNGHNGSHR
jgi:hypothetical protein